MNVFFKVPNFPECEDVVITRLGRKIPCYATAKTHLFTVRYELNI
jgi:hypothetical protein